MLFESAFSVKKIDVLLIIMICALSLLPVISFASEPRSLIINSGSSAPLTIDDSNGFYPDIIHEIFNRLNIPIYIRHVQSASSLKNVNKGRDDGVIARVKGLEKKLTNLIRVPEKVFEVEFVSFSNNKNIKIKTWDDLKDYNVAYIKGWKIFDNKVTVYKSLVKAKNMTQLFKLLQKKRVDIILSQRIVSQAVMKKMNYFPHVHHPLTTREMFIYMHKKNNALVPKISSEIKRIKKNGTYKKIYEKNIN